MHVHDRSAWYPIALTVSAVVAFLVSVVLVPVTVRALRRGGILDVPTRRSSHTMPTPRGGGVAVTLALVAGAALAAGSTAAAVVLLGTATAAAVGFIEDLRGIAITGRLAALAAVSAGIATEVHATGGLAFAVVGFVYVVAMANVTNFMDGINGISAAYGLVNGVALGLVAAAVGQPGLAAVAVATAAAMAGFAPYNVPRAKVFLGDAGSYGIGTALAATAAMLWAAGAPPEAVVAPSAIYLADTSTTLVSRWRRGETWYLPHREHVYQRLTDLGLSHMAVSALVLAFSAASAALGAGGWLDPAGRTVCVIGVLSLGTLYVGLPRALASRRAPAGGAV